MKGDAHADIPSRTSGSSKKRRRLISPSSCTSTSDSVSKLNDDALIEVLVRLPVKSVHRFKLVNKHFLSLISQPHFINYYRSSSSSRNSDDSFVVVHTLDECRNRIGKVRGLSLDNGRLFPLPFSGFSFEGYIPALKVPKNVSHFTVLAACKQLMLLEVELIEYPPRHEYYISNPITRQWIQLPPPKKSREIQTLKGYLGFTCDFDPSNGGTSFTVLKIVNSHNNFSPRVKDPYFIMQLLSSASSLPNQGQDHCWRWRVFRVPWPLGFSCDAYYPFDVVFYKGCFYWTGLTGLVAYDPYNNPHECTNVMSLPYTPTTPYSYGRKFYVAVDSEGHGPLCLIFHSSCISVTLLMLWELKGGGDGNFNNNNKHLSCSLKYGHNFPYDSLSPQSFSFSMSNWEKFYFLDNSRHPSTLLEYDLRRRSFRVVLKLPPTEEGGGYKCKAALPVVVGSWPTPLPQSKKGSRLRSSANIRLGKKPSP